MERYQHVVRFGVRGHAHKEFFSAPRSMTNLDKPVMMHIVGGSITPMTGDGKNPSFMTLDIDSVTMLPRNMHSHWFDLEDANTTGTPEWLTHDYLEEFGLKDLSPASMNDFATKVRDDDETA